MKKQDKSVEFAVDPEKAQPLMLLEYLNSWGSEFLFIFLLITAGFLLLFVNLVSSSIPETVPTILGIEISSFWATQFPIFVLIIAAIALAMYYNYRRRYIEGMMYVFYSQMQPPQQKSPTKPSKK
jgi:hypothetical protein